MQLETMLKAEKLPSYEDLAGYIFYTATGEDFDARRINRKTGFIGESAQYDVYLLYEPSLDYLKTTALTLGCRAKSAKRQRKKAAGVRADEISGQHPSGRTPHRILPVAV